MFRWLAATLTLCVVAVVVGVLGAGLPVVEKVQDGVSPPKKFEGAKQQAPEAQDNRLALADAAQDEVPDGSLPFSVVARLVIPDCHVSCKQAQEVPSRHDGEILCIATEVQPGEKVKPDDLITAQIGFLAVLPVKNEIIPLEELLWADNEGKKVACRRYKENGPIEPNTLLVVKQEKQFRRLKPGAEVKAGQLVGMINPDMALDELNAAVARLNGAEAKRVASEKTRDEAKNRMDRSDLLHKSGGASLEEFQGAVLTYQRYIYEEIENRQAINSARSEVNKALTNLQLHEIRARIPGVIKTIYKNTRGEAVKGLEKGADTVMTIQNPGTLKIDGKVEVQFAGRLKPGMEIVVEPIHRASHEQAFRGHLQEITSIAVSKNNLIVSASGENRVFVWDRSVEYQARGMLVHPHKVSAVACSPLNAKENICLTGADDGTGRLWDLDSLTLKNKQATKPIRELRDGHRKPITCVAFSPNGRLCATGSDDYSVCVWETASGSNVKTLTGHRGKVTSVQFLSEDQLLSAGGDKMLILWDLNDGKPLKKFDERGGEVSVLGVHPSSKQVLFDKGKELLLLSLPDKQYIGSLQNASGAMTFTTMALFSPDGNLILTNGAADGRLQIWRAPTARTRGYELSRLIWNSPATCGAFAPDGSFVVTGTKDSYVLVWPLPPKEMIEKQLKATIIAVDTSLEDSSGVMIHAEMVNPNNLLYTEDKATLVLYPETK
jgi:WD40 repeat protein